jgi:hypothetical protein
MNALRDRILELATDGTRAGYVSPTTNSLYERLAAWYRQRGEVAPISRALFYKWFGASPGSPSHQLLECVPGFAALLGWRSTSCSLRPASCARGSMHP